MENKIKKVKLGAAKKKAWAAIKKNISIGIDLGINTGIAVHDRDKKKIVRTILTGFVGAYEIMKEYAA